MVKIKKLTDKDIKALKRFEQSKRKTPYITYRKDGRIDRHKTLIKAMIIAKGQALLGRRGFVDTDKGKFTRSIKIFEPKSNLKFKKVNKTRRRKIRRR